MPESKLEAIESWQTGRIPSSVSLADLGETLTSDQLAEWLERLLQIQTASITQNDFYQAATQALTSLIGLNDGLVILKKQNQWQVTAGSSLAGPLRETFDPTVIQKVEQDRATFYDSGTTTPPTELDSAEAYVASPIFDSTGSIAGVLYGTRKLKNQNPSGIRKVEALVVQLLAGIISSGLARQIRQEEVDRFRIQLEQFASAKLVSAMAEDPRFLDSRERNITVVFGGVRGFTELSQRVGPEKTFSMIRNLMDQLTGSILDEEGFIIDYAGDGIAAMWNAPADQPDHAELACWAAINMQKVMDKLSEFWSFIAGESLSAESESIPAPHMSAIAGVDGD